MSSVEAIPRLRTEAADGAKLITGTLHLYVAFDWGEEIHLDQAKTLVPADYYTLPRTARTPSSIAYQPAPLRLKLAPVAVKLAEIGTIEGPAETTIFDFGAVSVALHVPFSLTATALRKLAGSLSEPGALVQAARAAVEPLYRQVLPAIENPEWSTLDEEYFVFQFLPEALAPQQQLLKEQDAWLAGLVRLEAGPLSAGEIAEALRHRLSYSPDDVLIADWAAAIVIDRDCDEILETIAFANLQLLEFRHIDDRLDRRLQGAYGLIHQLARRWLPFWRSHTQPLRALGALKVEANEMLERSSNVLKLIGDQYLARVYGLLVMRFHLEEWGRSIRQSISVLESIYGVVSDQTATFRAELLELIIVLLILFEIIKPFFSP